MHTNRETGLYSATNFSEEEIQRLGNFDFPTEATRRILNDQGWSGTRRFLDLGSGPNQNLGKMTLGQGWDYFPLDINRKPLEAMRSAVEPLGRRFNPIQADVRRLPVEDGSMGIVFERFVLMHLDDSDKAVAIEEMLRVSGNKVTLAEYDWEAMSSSSHPDEVDQIRESFYEFFDQAGVDPLVGQRLPELAREVAPGNKIKVQTVGREEGDYTGEILGLSNSAAEAMRGRNSEMADRLLETGGIVSRSQVRLTPPPIVFVTIEK